MINHKVCEKKIRQGLIAMNIQLHDQKINHLMMYLKEFYKWNKAYNLSSIRNPIDIIERHLFDSLILLPFLEKKMLKKNKHKMLFDRH